MLSTWLLPLPLRIPLAGGVRSDIHFALGTSLPVTFAAFEFSDVESGKLDGAVQCAQYMRCWVS